jgi:hypothetical protein
MSATPRSRQLRSYFFELKLKRPIIIGVIAGILTNLAYGSPNWKGVGGLFLMVTLVCLAWIAYQVVRYYGGPADEVVDRWLDEDIGELKEKSYNKLGLEEAEKLRDPLVIISPILWDVRGIDAKDLRYRKGKDKLVRFGVYQITIFQLADHLLASYIFYYNFIKKVALNERTYEFHYSDIVSVSTEEISTNYTLPDGKRLIRAQEFRLSVSSGENIRVTVNPHQILDMTNGELPSSGAEEAVRTIRKMLRDKKQAR